MLKLDARGSSLPITLCAVDHLRRCVGVMWSVAAPAAVDSRQWSTSWFLTTPFSRLARTNLTRAIHKADSDGARALLMEMDTPGGLVDSMRSMVAAILASKVPVIIFVGPSGARAGSAGFFLLEVGRYRGYGAGNGGWSGTRGVEMGTPDEPRRRKWKTTPRPFCVPT